MKQETKELYCLLLNGSYLRRRMNLAGVSEVVAYKGNQVPLKSFPACAGDDLKNLLKVDRKDKFKFTLNINMVRQLDGRTWYKKTFKEHLKKQKTCYDRSIPTVLATGLSALDGTKKKFI